MLNIGLSTCSKIINEELFRGYCENGISHMEISVAHDKYKDINYREIKQLSEKYGIILWSYHLPFSPFSEIDISKRKLMNKTVKYHSELIKRASDIGIRNFIIHPSGEPIIERFRKARMDNSKESLFRLAQTAKENGSTILVENLPRTCLGRDSADIIELLSAHDSLRVCFDTNHLLSESIEDFIKAVSGKIISTHISDYDNLNERHWLPGEGIIDWEKLYNSLINVGYTGPWLYEVSFDVQKTIIRNRRLTCSDFSKNAKEIFAGKKPTVISMPVNDLKGWK